MNVKHTIDKFVRVDRYYISGLHPHIWKHPEGEMVYFDDYVDLWAEKERLKAEVERLEQQVKYWRIEAETDHARWLRVLEELETLRKKP